MKKKTNKTPKQKHIHADGEPHCPYCMSENVYGISRVVGYFSVIDNWNASKRAEFKERQKGKYWSDELAENC